MFFTCFFFNLVAYFHIFARLKTRKECPGIPQCTDYAGNGNSCVDKCVGCEAGFKPSATGDACESKNNTYTDLRCVFVILSFQLQMRRNRLRLDPSRKSNKWIVLTKLWIPTSIQHVLAVCRFFFKHFI